MTSCWPAGQERFARPDRGSNLRQIARRDKAGAGAVGHQCGPQKTRPEAGYQAVAAAETAQAATPVSTAVWRARADRAAGGDAAAARPVYDPGLALTASTATSSSPKKRRVPRSSRNTGSRRGCGLVAVEDPGPEPRDL